MTRIAIILLLSTRVLLAKEPEPAPLDAPYNNVFDPWRACALAEPLAARGAPDALRTMFLSAYVRCSWPFNGPEIDWPMVRAARDFGYIQKRPNQAMDERRTAVRFNLEMISTPPLRPTRALVRRRSSCSR